MALPRIAAHPARDYAQIETSAHGLIILPVSDVLPADLPRQAQWRAVLKCKAMKPGELAKTPLAQICLMAGMHEDMNGPAVALALTLAAAGLALPVAIDCWRAIARNHLSPAAYKQNDVITALDGTTIEVMHADAEGRMVLADTLLLATDKAGHDKRGKAGGKSKAKPDLVIDFATITGSMHVALGARYSGVFASSEALGVMAVEAGRASGERIRIFPLDEDYDPALDSKVADVKRCTLDGEADHILAARFLQRFTNRRPWLHVDLSASSCSGGLGATASDLTGFGVAWDLTILVKWLSRE